MLKKMKIAFALGVQLAVIGAIGDYVGWPYMRYVFVAAGLSFFAGLVLLLIHYSKD